MNNFTPQEIQDIYNKHCVKLQEYYKKYENVPTHLMDDSWNWSGKDYARVPCLLDFKEWVIKYKISSPEKLLYTDGSDPELFYLNPKSKKLIYYQFHNNQNDLHQLDLKEKDFDFVLFNQTFEHLHNPYLALKNIVNHVKSGGYVFTSVPTLSIPHMTPIHFWGINKIGLVVLFKHFNLEILEVGEWGNIDYIIQMYTEQTWPDYKALMKDGKIINDPNRSCQCWILARKPLIN